LRNNTSYYTKKRIFFKEEEQITYKSYINENGEWKNRKITFFGVVRSVVSQLKPGQDMTRVGLPSIFLEPYSILELAGNRNSSYFHILNECKDGDSFHRLLSIIRYYLACYMELVFEKKPYNSILGETHLCSAIHPSNTSFESKFVGEQVSHHPPISAFTIVNKNLKINLESNVSNAVKFHGNSVGVITEGKMKIRISLKDNEFEEYSINKPFPDILISNVILGTRNMAWTGEVEIYCESTGYRATMLFHGKKKKKNHVEGQIYFGGNEIASFNGIWAEEKIYLERNTEEKTKILLFDPTQYKPFKIQFPEELDNTDTLKNLV